MQQPDSTVLSESSFKEKSPVGCDLSSSRSTAANYQDPPQIRRSSVISVNYDSDPSDNKINTKPSNKNKQFNSPLTNNLLNQDCSKTHNDLEDSVFFSPNKPEVVGQSSGSGNNSKPSATTTTQAMVPDDFYIDDFDIDDFNDSDIPDYFDEPTSSSVSRQNTTSGAITVKEGASKSPWEKKPATPTSAQKPMKICSPGKSQAY